METNSASKRYETRRSARAKELAAKSRVDWNRTKRTKLLDSEEEDDEITSGSEKEIQTSSEDEVEGKGDSVVNGSKEETTANESSLPVDAGCEGTAEEDVEEESIVPGKLKRSRSSVMYDDSDGSDDSDIVRKVFAKRGCIIDEEDVSAEQKQHTSPAEDKTQRKRERLTKLRELSQRRSTRARSGSNRCEDAEDDPLILEDIYPSSLKSTDINDSTDDDSMKDFIVEEDEGKELKQEESEDDERQPQEKKHATSRRTLLEHYIPRLVSHTSLRNHLKRIVRAFLINAVDCTFLTSLYEGERQKRYAQDMLTSLRYLDDRIVQPRLDNLLSRSRWKERYKERVDSYPNVCVMYGSAEQRSCQACELQRYCRVTVVLSGKLYNTNTMETDDFMSSDKQRLKVGIVCANRTEVYHKLKHFKYKLYQDCCSVMKQDECQDEPLKDRVDRVFGQLEEDGWLQKHCTGLEECTNNADYFQEEKMD